MSPLSCLLHATSQGPSLPQQWQLLSVMAAEEPSWLEIFRSGEPGKWRTWELENLGSGELEN